MLRPAFILAALTLAVGHARADDAQAMADNGLRWLASQQDKVDGHWEVNGGQYPTATTALAAMCFLMEGSTLRDGKYSGNLRRATDYLLRRTQPNGLIGNPSNPRDMERYTYAQGFSVLFLACVYGEEEDESRRKELEKVLIKGVAFIQNGQSSRGGWYYVSAKDCGDQDEGSTTITQLQALRAARNSGIEVSKQVIDRSVKYLKDSTTRRGGVIYSLSQSGGVASDGQERPALTAAAIACAFSAGDYHSEYAKKWLAYCRDAIPVGKGRMPHDEYQNYYFAQSLYVLGDDGYARLFPGASPESRLTWTKYRTAMVDTLRTSQRRDGSWDTGYMGPVYSTSMYLPILLLEKATLPIYQR